MNKKSQQSVERAARAAKKHELIRDEYHKLHKKGLRDDVILSKLAEKFFLSENTVYAIIWKTAHYHEKKQKPAKSNQLNLFE